MLIRENLGQHNLCQILKFNKMKKIYLVLLTVFLNFAFFSCTPEALNENVNVPQACCDDDGDIPPPPPPPPPGDGNG